MIELFQGARAEYYDRFINQWVPDRENFMKKIPKILNASKCSDVLVVGCGTGAEIKELIEYKKDWFITGVDPSPDMIKQAKQNFQIHTNIRLVEGVVTDLGNSEKYDACTLLLVLHFMKDDGSKENLLKNIASRVKRNAPLILLDITGSDQEIKDNLRVLKKLLPRDMDSGEVSKRIDNIQNNIHYVDDHRIHELLAKAGFEKPVCFFQSTIYKGWLTKKI